VDAFDFRDTFNPRFTEEDRQLGTENTPSGPAARVGYGGQSGDNGWLPAVVDETDRPQVDLDARIEALEAELTASAEAREASRLDALLDEALRDEEQARQNAQGTRAAVAAMKSGRKRASYVKAAEAALHQKKSANQVSKALAMDREQAVRVYMDMVEVTRENARQKWIEEATARERGTNEQLRRAIVILAGRIEAEQRLLARLQRPDLFPKSLPSPAADTPNRVGAGQGTPQPHQSAISPEGGGNQLGRGLPASVALARYGRRPQNRPPVA
jgi:hypothetical protein